MQLVDCCGDKAQDKLCGNSTYQAAGDRRGRAANKLVTGRFLMGCPHMLLLKMASMPAEHGHERYGYAYLMMACKFFEALWHVFWSG
jgi:hypothetical protein